MDDLHNLGIIIQIIGIFIVFPLKLIVMYAYALKISYNVTLKKDDDMIKNLPKNLQWDWLMIKIRIKIIQLEFRKWFLAITKNFPISFPEAFKPNPFLVTIGGSIIVLGLILQLK